MSYTLKSLKPHTFTSQSTLSNDFTLHHVVLDLKEEKEEMNDNSRNETKQRSDRGRKSAF